MVEEATPCLLYQQEHVKFKSLRCPPSESARSGESLIWSRERWCQLWKTAVYHCHLFRALFSLSTCEKNEGLSVWQMQVWQMRWMMSSRHTLCRICYAQLNYAESHLLAHFAFGCVFSLFHAIDSGSRLMEADLIFEPSPSVCLLMLNIYGRAVCML